MSKLAAWIAPRPHDVRRSVDVVRIAVAAVIATHPLYTLTHADALHALAAGIAARGLPAATALAWIASLSLLLAAALLLARRYAAPAAVGASTILAAGALVLYAPRWYVAGGASDPAHPGVEFNVLLIGCLAGVAVAYWPRRADDTRAAALGLDVIRLSGALLILPHPLHAFVTWDVAGMRAFGDGMGEVGLPFARAMVWIMLVWQMLCSTLIATRRLVVPACLGHIFVLGIGIAIVHWPDWFMVGPGVGGMEFPLLYVTCYVACILAYWPPRRNARDAAA